MPKYVLPKPSKANKAGDSAVESSRGSHPKTVYLPANKKILDSLDIGNSYKVVLEGKLVSLSASETESSFDVELKSVEVYGKNSFEELSREDDE